MQAAANNHEQEDERADYQSVVLQSVLGLFSLKPHWLLTGLSRFAELQLS